MIGILNKGGVRGFQIFARDCDSEDEIGKSVTVTVVTRSILAKGEAEASHIHVYEASEPLQGNLPYQIYKQQSTTILHAV